MTSHFHNKHHHSAHIRQFVSKSSYIDRFIFTDDSELNVELLVKNLKNVIMKKLLMSCVTGSLTFSSASSAAASQSSTPAPVSGSPAPATPVPTTPGFAASAFVTSSSHFKKMLCRLNKSYLSRITLSFNSVKIIKKIVMSFVMHEVMIFTDTKKLFITVKFNIAVKNIYIFRNKNMNIVLFYIFTLISEIILIEDDNTAETILFYS
ncbi:hypothetical protein BDDG_09666 [Blastomyces dermatitidis ATCC 18188]|uniref:Uncharacterized protein n=1 Tax=Ajellomyces dermatitidis (strain ATCC 18188 / CBS 674.68) TaxID=653446 RepID=F2TU03_AJEDA|nr:hypothetical protein BDDG_09666 [Blastomyces dermatitidis ATCC 18188]